MEKSFATWPIPDGKKDVSQEKKQSEKVLRPIGTYLSVDANGYLVGEASKDKIQEKLRPVLDEGIRIAQEKLGSNLDGVYIRGSAAKGGFVSGISDLDFQFVVKVKPDDAFREDIKKTLETGREKYPYILKISDGLRTVKNFTKGTSPINKYQSVCLWGEDRTKELPSLRPGKETIVHLNTILTETKQAMSDIERSTQPEKTKLQSIWICKRLIRSAHELVAEKLQRFTRDIYPCYEGASSVYPQYEPLFHQTAELAVFGTTDKKLLLDTVKSMDVFLEKEIPHYLGGAVS